MKTKDQILLEECYRLVYEQEEEKKLVEPEPGYLPLGEIPTHNKTECFCGSGKPFHKCCGVRKEIGDLVQVLSQKEVPDMDFSGMKEPYKSMWKKSIGKVGVLIGLKKVPINTIYNTLEDDYPYTVLGVKMPNGYIYDLDADLIDGLTEEQEKLYKMKKELPELEGIF